MKASQIDDIVDERVSQCLDYLQRERVPPARGGQKDYAPDGSWLEAKKLDNFLSERHSVLSEERVRIKNVLATAEWVTDLSKARVTYKVGKWWHTMGHNQDGEEWLLPEEAMYLMDEGHLEVYYEGLPISVQEAYSLMLADNVPLHHYVVYAHLNRYGYILNRFTELPNVTEYEKKLGMDKVMTKPSKKRKNNKKTNDVAECSSAKQPCDSTLKTEDKMESDSEVAGVKHEILSSENTEKCKDNFEVGDAKMDVHVTEEDESSVTMNTEQSCGGIEFKGKNSEEGNWTNAMVAQFTMLNGKNSESVSFSSWDWDTLEVPNILSSCRKGVQLPSPPSNTLPPGIQSIQEATFLPVCIGYKKPDTLEYSFGMEEKKKWGKKTGKAGNWKEHKEQQEILGEEGALLQSPAGALWAGEVKPLVNPQDAASLGAILKKLRIIPSLSVESQPKSSNQSDKAYLKIAYNMFKPDRAFTKSNTGVPLARLCILQEQSSLPDLSTVVSLHQQSWDGVPLKIAVVENGAISFFSYDLVDIPVQISPLG